MGQKKRQNNKEKAKDTVLEREFEREFAVPRKSLYFPKKLPIDSLSLPLTKFITNYYTELRTDNELPEFKIEEANRISQAISASLFEVVIALLYIERVKDRNPEYLKKIAPMELYLISMMLANKFMYDPNTKYEVIDAVWAATGRITLSRLIQLEANFVNAIDWKLFVSREQLMQRLEQLSREVAYREVLKRNTCSYTELNSIMNYKYFIIVVYILLVIYACLTIYLLTWLILYRLFYSTTISSNASCSRIQFVEDNKTDIILQDVLLNRVVVIHIVQDGNNNYNDTISQLNSIVDSLSEYCNTMNVNEINKLYGDNNIRFHNWTQREKEWNLLKGYHQFQKFGRTLSVYYDTNQGIIDIT